MTPLRVATLAFLLGLPLLSSCTASSDGTSERGADAATTSDDGRSRGDARTADASPDAGRDDDTGPPADTSPDGADVSSDGGRHDAGPPVSCGDGVVDEGEACDDGTANARVPDACRPDCTLPTCGDGIVDSDETCDPGADSDCSDRCAVPSCGDGVVDEDAGEECDDGEDNGSAPGACRETCVAPACGDGVVDGTDDPSAAPLFEETFTNPVVTGPTGATGHVCDDGATCPAETCDVSEDGSASAHGICQALGYERAAFVAWGGSVGVDDPSMPHAYNWSCEDYTCTVGDPFDGDDCFGGEMLASITCVSFGEECDDGNTEDGDGCSSRCVVEGCGDGVVQADEACDDGAGNGMEPDACRPDCTLPVCGDGIVDSDERCDDGEDNAEEPGACRPDCTPPRCGDGIADITDDPPIARFDEPVVTGPTGATGHVCDDGATCPRGSCELGAEPDAPEHGICEALGFDDAVSVEWGGGAGGDDDEMPHAYNWACEDFDCGPGDDEYDGDNCSTGEMLATITCRRASEECDDGNDELGDGCAPNCRIEGCGDGFVQEELGEECDDGLRNSFEPGACRPDCTEPICGDSVTDPGEECDDGIDNADEPGACRTDCSAPTCGDGIVDDVDELPVREFSEPAVTNPFGMTGRVCDDGSSCSADTCDVSDDPEAPEHGICQSLGMWRAISVEWGGGAGGDDEPMPHAYNWSCEDYVCGPSDRPYSEDNCGTREMLASITCAALSETCDDGNTDPGDGCGPTCLVEGCGDGIVQEHLGETCDDGDREDGDGCSAACAAEVCGDGVVQEGLGEECDDGDTVDGDGCSRRCQREGRACEILYLYDPGAGPLPDGVAERVEVEGFSLRSVENGAERPAADPPTYTGADVVIYHQRDRRTTDDEIDALDAFSRRRGALLVTGYDTLASPSDEPLAALLRVETSGDMTGVDAAVVRSGDHPAVDGVYGSFDVGHRFELEATDLDRVRASEELGSASLIDVADEDASKLTYAEDPLGGAVYYWNGNSEASDWSENPDLVSVLLNLLRFECP